MDRSKDREVFSGLRYPGWTLASLFVAGLILMPIGVLGYIALTQGLGSFDESSFRALRKSGTVTLQLMAGVAIGTAVVGTTLAYLLSFYRFPGRGVLAWLVVLPLALPPYIAAYGFVEFLDFAGPVQKGLRWIFANTTMQDVPRITKQHYWFPEFRSLTGAIVILTSIFYPYVYITVRATFALQGAHAAEVARTLGARPLSVALLIVVPLASPAIMLGVILCLMETINDIGAVTYLGVRTMTFEIDNQWLNRRSLGGAAVIAMVLFIGVLLLVLAERKARSGSAFFEKKTGRGRISSNPNQIRGFRGYLTAFICFLPPLIGFGIPLHVHIDNASRRLSFFANPDLWKAVLTSVTLASVAALLTLLIAILLVYTSRLNPARWFKGVLSLAASGYAVPGTMIALGVLIPILRLDNAIDNLTERAFGYNWGLLIFGTGFPIVFAYAVRFMALARGGIDAALLRVSPNLDSASRTLGEGPLRTLILVILPAIWPALLAAGVLVFIDAIKELSATNLLQPVGIDTLAMRIFQHASAGHVERTGPGSLIMIALALGPTLFLAHSLERRVRASSGVSPWAPGLKERQV